MQKTITRLIVVLLSTSLFFSPAIAATSSLPDSKPAAGGTHSDPDPATVRGALKEFKSLPRRERRYRLREARKAWKQYKADRRAGRDDSDQQILEIILCILLPPLAVYLHEDEINTKFWISLVLTLIFWIPGVIYSLLVVLDQI